MMKIYRLDKFIIFASFVFILVNTSACAPIKYDPALKGRVVDGETGEPIPGTVILREWNKHYTTLAGGHGEYYDARETVADENGEFKIPGKGLMFFTNVTKGVAYVFKAGYNWNHTDYERLQETDGIVMLQNIMDNKKLMRNRLPPKPTDAPYEKMKAYIKENDRRDIMLGITPSKYWKGKNE